MTPTKTLITQHGPFTSMPFIDNVNEEDDLFLKFSNLSAKAMKTPADELMILEPFENSQYYLWHAQSTLTGEMFLFLCDKQLENLEWEEQSLEQIQDLIKLLR